MSIFIKLQLNQYAIVNSNQPTYDDDGNMLTNGNWSYTWNGENRLIRAANSATGVKLEFAYDYMGRRIFKKVYNGETLEKHLCFVYDGYKLIEERNALDNDAAVRKYVWQPESLDRDVPLTVYDVASDKTYYFHTDANKNVTELSDESGNVVAHYEYSPFGSLTKVTGDYAGSNPFRFSSEYYDEEIGLVYYNYRYYNPELGRWISRDPIEEQGGYNLYGMLRNNLLCGWDELGLDERGWGRKIIDWLYCLFCGRPVKKITDDTNTYLSQRDELLGGQEERQAAIDSGKNALGFMVEEAGTSLAFSGAVKVLGATGKGLKSAGSISKAAETSQISNKTKLSNVKKALKEFHKKLGGSIPKNTNTTKGKFNSPMRGTSKKRYRLDPPHDKAGAESYPHINYWDYTNGKRNRGGVSGSIPIK